MVERYGVTEDDEKVVMGLVVLGLVSVFTWGAMAGILGYQKVMNKYDKIRKSKEEEA